MNISTIKEKPQWNTSCKQAHCGVRGVITCENTLGYPPVYSRAKLVWRKHLAGRNVRNYKGKLGEKCGFLVFCCFLQLDWKASKLSRLTWLCQSDALYIRKKYVISDCYKQSLIANPVLGDFMEFQKVWPGWSGFWNLKKIRYGHAPHKACVFHNYVINSHMQIFFSSLALSQTVFVCKDNPLYRQGPNTIWSTKANVQSSEDLSIFKKFGIEEWMLSNFIEHYKKWTPNVNAHL